MNELKIKKHVWTCFFSNRAVGCPGLSPRRSLQKKGCVGDVGWVTLPNFTIFSNVTHHHPSTGRGTQTYFTQKVRNPCRTYIKRVILCYIEFVPLVSQPARVSLRRRFWKEQNCWIAPDPYSLGVSLSTYTWYWLLLNLSHYALRNVMSQVE